MRDFILGSVEIESWWPTCCTSGGMLCNGLRSVYGCKSRLVLHNLPHYRIKPRYMQEGVSDRARLFILRFPLAIYQILKGSMLSSGVCHGNREVGRWVDMDFWKRVDSHQSTEMLPSVGHDVDMGKVQVPHFGVHLSEEDFQRVKIRIEDSSYDYLQNHIVVSSAQSSNRDFFHRRS